MVEVMLYRSTDGQMFTTKEACLYYEKELAIDSERRYYNEIREKIMVHRHELGRTDREYKKAIEAVRMAHKSSAKGVERRYAIASAEFSRVKWLKILHEQVAKLRSLILDFHRSGKALGYHKSVVYVFKMTGEAVKI